MRRWCPAIRGMKREIDRELARRGDGDGRTSNVKLGRGGIREIEFIVQALQLLYGGDDAWLRERNSLKALFRLTERGYLAPELGRTLSHALVHLRTVEHRLQLLHELQTHTLPSEPVALGLWRVASASAGQPAAAARAFRARHRTITDAVHRAFTAFFAERPAPRRHGPRLPSLVALGATGFADPEHARQNLRLILEGRPLVPYAGALGRRAGAPLPDAARRALEEPRSGRGAEPVRAVPVGGGAARGLRRAAGRQRADCSRGWCGSAPAAILLTQLLDRAARAAGLAGRSLRAEPPAHAGHGAGRAGPGVGAGGGARGASRPAPADQAGRGADDRVALPAGGDVDRAVLRAR